jgi:gliding motility-associated-like protein
MTLIARKKVDFLYDPCYDSFPKFGEPKITIKVEQAKSIDSTNVPNVFTPGIEPYSYWRIEDDVSISDFEIAIYNRYGKRVYHFRGNIRDWTGWDGYNKSTNNFVTTGVYYFVVKAIQPLPDFQTQKLPENLSFTKKGFIHVYNGSD